MLSGIELNKHYNFSQKNQNLLEFFYHVD